MRAFKKVGGMDSQVAKFQENVAEVFTPLVDNPLLNGVLIEGQELTTGQSNLVAHGLGRPYRGFLVVDSSASSSFWTQPADFPGRFIDIRCSANTAVSLWIF